MKDKDRMTNLKRACTDWFLLERKTEEVYNPKLLRHRVPLDYEMREYEERWEGGHETVLCADAATGAKRIEREIAYWSDKAGISQDEVRYVTEFAVHHADWNEISKRDTQRQSEWRLAAQVAKLGIPRLPIVTGGGWSPWRKIRAEAPHLHWKHNSRMEELIGGTLLPGEPAVNISDASFLPEAILHLARVYPKYNPLPIEADAAFMCCGWSGRSDTEAVLGAILKA